MTCTYTQKAGDDRDRSFLGIFIGCRHHDSLNQTNVDESGQISIWDIDLESEIEPLCRAIEPLLRCKVRTLHDSMRTQQNPEVRGLTLSVPEAILRRQDEGKYVDALLSLMERCFAFRPSDRPSAKDGEMTYTSNMPLMTSQQST